MLHRSFKPAKCKTSCKLATSRLKLMKNKKGVQLNQMKRDLAQLLESGQDQTARIRVEHVIREEKMIAAYELIEIFCELIVARMPIIESQKNCPIDLKEAVTSVIFASPRCGDIAELVDIKKHLTAKYGKEFTSAAVELRPDCGVSRMLVEKLSAVAPDGPTKIKVLKAIADEHNIQWEPKAFGEKDAKPPDDLLNGPTNLAKTSTMNVEPPMFQVPASQEQKHQEPTNYYEQKHQEPTNYYEQNKRFSTGYQDVAPKDTGANTSPSGASYHDVRHDARPEARNSGMGSDRMELRQSFHGDNNDRHNWNMGFKDAASAAQAAAESAELASMAARAAAELSRQHSSESHKISTRDSREERQEQNTRAPSMAARVAAELSRQHSSESQKISTRDSREERQEHNTRAPTNRSFHDRNPNLSRQQSTESLKSHVRHERLEKHVTSNLRGKNDHAKDTSNHSDDDRNPSINQQYLTEFRKSNIDGLKDDRSPKLQDERAEKQTYEDHRGAKISSPSMSLRSGKSLNDDDMLLNSVSNRESFSRKSSFEEEANTRKKVESLSVHRQDSFESENSNPFGGRIEKQFSSGSSVPDSKIDSVEDSFTVIDQGTTHRDTLKYDYDYDYDDADDDVVVFDEDNSEESRRIIDIGPTYDEVESTKPYFPSPDRNLSMGRSDKVESIKSFFPSPNRKSSMDKSNSDDFGNVVDYSAGPKFDSEDEFEVSSPNVENHTTITAEEANHGTSRKPEFNDVSGESSVLEPIKSFSHKGEESSSSGSESGSELKFRMLTGGLRNKGYSRPPYKKSTEGPAPIDQTAPVTVRTSFNSRGSINADDKLRPTVATAVSDTDSDDSVEEFPQHNSKVNTKPSLKPSFTSLDSDSSDSNEDVKTPSNRSRFGSGLSRRTKATPLSFRSRVQLGVETQTQTEPRSQARSSDQELGWENEATAKGSFNAPEPRTRTRTSAQLSMDKRADPKPTNGTKGSFNTPEPRTRTRTSAQLSMDKRADPKPTNDTKGSFNTPEPRTRTRTSAQLSMDKKADPKPTNNTKAYEPRSQTHKLSQWGNMDQPNLEKPAVLKTVTEPRTESSKVAEQRTKLYEGNSKSSVAEPLSQTRLAANRAEKEVASKLTSEASTSAVASSNVSESAKKSSSSLSREDSSGKNSGGGASHVHPKLPNFEDVFAHFQAIRENRK